jgi:hypothetical protein
MPKETIRALNIDAISRHSNTACYLFSANMLRGTLYVSRPVERKFDIMLFLLKLPTDTDFASNVEMG